MHRAIIFHADFFRFQKGVLTIIEGQEPWSYLLRCERKEPTFDEDDVTEIVHVCLSGIYTEDFTDLVP